MNPVQIPIGSELKCELNGNVQIVISDHQVKKLGRSRFSLCFYPGYVSSGTYGCGEARIEASILVYASTETGITLHNQLTKFDHPYVMRSLGYGKGIGQYSEYIFVALPTISNTLGEWLQPGSGAGQMARFTEQFIEIVRQTVKGLKALHDMGFHCPNLQGKDIAITMENGSITVKIWNFSATDSEKEKDRDWVNLRDFLYIAACNNSVTMNGPESYEIEDLLRRMQTGKLKGLDILNHSALLTVKQKFDNVLALNLNVLLHYKPKEPEQSSTHSAVQQSSKDLSQEKSTGKTEELYNLEEYLDENDREVRGPDWIDGKRIAKPINFRKLLNDFRNMLEHENEHIPKKMTMTITANDRLNGVKELDLEHDFRKRGSDSYLKMQQWALDPKSKLPKSKPPN